MPFNRYTDAMKSIHPEVEGVETQESRDSRAAVATIAGGSAPPSAGEYVRIPTNLIEADPEQIRTHFDEEGIRHLAASLAQNGQEQPVLVRRHPQLPNRYMLIDGERRWRAAQLGGLPTLEAIVKDKDARQAVQTQIISNLDREGNNPYEVARALRRLSNLRSEEIGKKFTNKELAEQLGWPINRVSDYLNIEKLSDGDGALERYVVEREIKDPVRVRQLARLRESDGAAFDEMVGREATPSRKELVDLLDTAKPASTKAKKSEDGGKRRKQGGRDTGPPKTAVTVLLEADAKYQNVLAVTVANGQRYRFALTDAQLAALLAKEPE